MGAQVGVVPGIPFVIVDTVQNADHPVSALAQRSFQAHAERRLADFSSVGRTDRGHAVGVLETRFQRIDGAAREIILIQLRPRHAEPQVPDRRARHPALITYVMYGHDRLRPPKYRIRGIDRL